jgi:hypothetical protein
MGKRVKMGGGDKGLDGGNRWEGGLEDVVVAGQGGEGIPPVSKGVGGV